MKEFSMDLIRPALVIVSVSISLFCSTLFGQAPVAPVLPVTPVPVNLLYWAFFGQITRLEQVASDLEKQGKNGTSTREYYKPRLKLTDAEHSALRSVSFSCDAAVKAQDQAAHAVILRARAQTTAQVSSPGPAIPPSIPPPPPELALMQAQRDATIQAHIDRLKAEMGAPGYQKIDTFVKMAFARVNYVSVPPLPGPPLGLGKPQSTGASTLPRRPAQ